MDTRTKTEHTLLVTAVFFAVCGGAAECAHRESEKEFHVCGCSVRCYGGGIRGVSGLVSQVLSEERFEGNLSSNLKIMRQW